MLKTHNNRNTHGISTCDSKGCGKLWKGGKVVEAAEMCKQFPTM